nr:MAG TPA: hypothetical protein [Caudoviricetes sp.]
MNFEYKFRGLLKRPRALLQKHSEFNFLRCYFFE